LYLWLRFRHRREWFVRRIVFFLVGLLHNLRSKSSRFPTCHTISLPALMQFKWFHVPYTQTQTPEHRPEIFRTQTPIRSTPLSRDCRTVGATSTRHRSPPPAHMKSIVISVSNVHLLPAASIGSNFSGLLPNGK